MSERKVLRKPKKKKPIDFDSSNFCANELFIIADAVTVKRLNAIVIIKIKKNKLKTNKCIHQKQKHIKLVMVDDLIFGQFAFESPESHKLR